MRIALISSLAPFNWSGSEAAHFGVAAALRPLSDTKGTSNRFYKVKSKEKKISETNKKQKNNKQTKRKRRDLAVEKEMRDGRRGSEESVRGGRSGRRRRSRERESN